MTTTIFPAALLLLAAATHNANAQVPKPIRFILVGDSTMASNTGYGDAFCARVAQVNSCVNLAKAGRSSSSFRAEGRWDTVQRLLRENAAFGATYVLIQFGHNDQPGKPGRSTDVNTEFPANMRRYSQDVKALGGVPVLITPLTRRTFQDGKLDNTFGPWVDALKTTAAAEHIAMLDLNAASYAAVQAMGQDQADTLAMAPRPANFDVPPTPSQTETPGAPRTRFDRTHLGAKGAAYFSSMVVEELKRAIPDVADKFQSESGR